MSEWERLFEAIESHRFSALVNVASDLKTFVRAVKSQPEFQQLTDRVQSQDPEPLVQRVRQLVDAKPEPGFEHPHDAALAAYILALESGNPDDAVEAARVVLDRAEGCWWARKVAEDVGASADANVNLSW